MTHHRGRHEDSRGRPSAEDTGSRTGDDDLAVRLSSLARGLQDPDDPEQTLVKVVQGALGVVPGAEEGSISLITGRRHVRALAASSPLPERVDALQGETGQGPCLEAIYQQQTVRVPDMAAEERWPRFSSRAAELGAASMLSFQLYVEEDDLGALNLYSTTAGAFTDESEHVGLLYAAHAAIAYSGARTQQQLAEAVATREVVGRATGILMERHKVSAEQAFDQLARESQQTNRKLRDVAEDLARTGALGP